MNVRWACFMPMWTFIAVLAFVARLEAQVVPPPGAVGPGPVYSPESPAMGGGMPGGVVYADPSMAIQGYGPGPMMGDPAMYGGGPGYGDPAAMYGGGYGDPGYPGEDCGPLHRGVLGDFFGLIGPYADGGCGAPRYMDVSLEAMWLQRDGTGRNIPLASEGIAGPVVLSTNSLNFEERPGFRFTAWIPFRSRGNIEFTYYGQFHYRDAVQVNSNNNLFSVYSQFGTFPPGGFVEDGFANYNRIEYSSVFDNFEINYRKHWQGANSRFQGSWLAGVRYFKLDEDFDYVTVSEFFNQGMSRTSVNTNNSLTGGQIGGDLWMCLIPGLRLGAEGKVGVFGNHSQQSTLITGTTFIPAYTESVVDDDVAFVGDAAFYLTYRLSQQFNLKVGYNFLYANGVSLATENFNPVPPNTSFGGVSRTPQLNDNGAVFYHGASVGLEYNW